MPEFNVVEMYKRGYSIDSIINQYYRWKLKERNRNVRIKSIINTTDFAIDKKACEIFVYTEIINFVNCGMKNTKNLEGS